MPLEGQRRRARKKVRLPSDDIVEIPVITSITFIDATDRAQQTEYTVDNTTTAARTVHVDQVHPTDTSTDPATQDEGTSLPVERIDVWPVLDATDRHQETQVRFDNTTGNDALPPHFSTHKRTHVYRYYQDPANQDDGGVWIDSELIDEFDVLDPDDRYQETGATLRNPAREDMAGQVDPNDPDITEYDDNGDPAWPVRTDPFQNIVNYSSGIYLIITFEWRDFLTPELGERCMLTSTTPNPIVHTFVSGVQSQVHDASYITVELEDTSLLGALVNGETAFGGQPERVTTANQTIGYAKFPDCFVCSSTGLPNEILYPHGDFMDFVDPTPVLCPPGPDPAPIRADPVPYNDYTISFLFEISPSDEESPTAERTTIPFTILGLPSPRVGVWLERTLPVLPSGSTVGNHKFEYLSNDTSRMRFQARVYDKSQVDIYLADKKFPLRLKTLSNPTDSDAARDETKFFYKTIAQFSGAHWIDASNNVHEPLTDEEFATGDELGTFEFTTGDEGVIVTFEFDKLTIGPGASALPGNVEVKRPLAWPKEPPNQTVTAVLTGSIPSGTYTLGDYDPRQYQYCWRISAGLECGENFLDFGIEPNGATA